MPAFLCIPFKLTEKSYYFDTLATLFTHFNSSPFHALPIQAQQTENISCSFPPNPVLLCISQWLVSIYHFQHVWTIKLCECDSVPGFRIQITKTESSSHIWNASKYTEREVQKISEAPRRPCSSPDSVAPGLASQDLRGILDYPSWL